MAYADNLYPADDSDTESFSNELSPTDGYFTNRDHPNNVIVSDPTQKCQSNATVSKAREASEEAGINPNSHMDELMASNSPVPSRLHVPMSTLPIGNTPNSTTTYPLRPAISPHGQQEDLYSETAHLFHSSASPPAYSIAASQPIAPESNRNYSTISTRELGEGFREPESMGHPEDYNERFPLWMKRVKKTSRRTVIRNILLATLVLTLLLSFALTMIKVGQNKRKVDPGLNDPSHLLPDRKHGPYCPSATISHRETLPTYAFGSGKKLGVLQINQGRNREEGISSVSTRGEIILRRLPKDKEDQNTGFITFDIWSSAPGIPFDINMDLEEQRLTVTTPKFVNSSPFGSHCISLEITVWMPQGAIIKHTSIEATDLSLRVSSSVDMHSDKTSLVTCAGNIYFPAMEKADYPLLGGRTVPGSAGNGYDSGESVASTSRSNINGGDEDAYSVSHLISNHDLSPTKALEEHALSGNSAGISSLFLFVATVSGDIKGSFKLHDKLQVESISGNIDITVLPQPMAETNPKPAQLILSTTSGSIHARLPIWHPGDIPDRDYRTSVKTHSGNIKGDFVIGSEATFQGISGAIDISILPTTYEDSDFSSETTSGATTIAILPPLGHDEVPSSPSLKIIDIGNDDAYLINKPDDIPLNQDTDATNIRRSLSHLKSTHKSSSGSITAHYPSAWEGEIVAGTVSGGIRIGGEDIRIIKDSRKDWVHREVVARKGTAETASTLEDHGISGSISIVVGESSEIADRV